MLCHMLIYNNVDRYKDASKTLFKSSTRLECMMQDYPRTLAPSAKVGFTVSPILKLWRVSESMLIPSTASGHKT